MPITAAVAEPIYGKVRQDIAIISSLGAHLVGNYVLVKLSDGEGRVGLGEASVTCIWSGETQQGVLALFEQEIKPVLQGADPFDVDWIMRKLDRAIHANSFAKGAVEMALLDLQGKTLGVPVYQLLGGRNPEAAEKGVRLKFVVGAVEPPIAAERAARMTERGWTCIKVKVGRHEHPRADLERLKAVREAIGPTVMLTVDANGGYSVEQAVWAAARFEQLGVALFEQPTKRGDHVAMAAVRRRSGLPIMADESVFTPQDALAVIRHEAADVLSLYPRQAWRSPADAEYRPIGRGGRHRLHDWQQPGTRGGHGGHGPCDRGHSESGLRTFSRRLDRAAVL